MIKRLFLIFIPFVLISSAYSATVNLNNDGSNAVKIHVKYCTKRTYFDPFKEQDVVIPAKSSTKFSIGDAWLGEENYVYFDTAEYIGLKNQKNTGWCNAGLDSDFMVIPAAYYKIASKDNLSFVINHSDDETSSALVDIKKIR